jgi:hypothetical protein
MHLLLLALILLFQNQAQAPRAQQETTHPKSDESQTTQIATVNTFGWSGDKETPTHQTEDQSAYDPRKDCLYRWYMRATIFAAGGALIGVFILIVQTVFLKRSTDAAKVAALAANTSATSVMNSERARVDVNIGRVNPQSPTHFIEIYNFGRTAATIIKWELEQVIFAELVTDLPNTYARRPLQGFDIKRILLVDRPTNIFQFDLVSYIPDEVRDFKHTAFFFATLEYSDIFDIPHRTEAVYKYRVSTHGGLVEDTRYSKYD